MATNNALGIPGLTLYSAQEVGKLPEEKGVGKTISKISDGVTDFIGARGMADTFGAALARTKAPEEQKNLVETPSFKQTLGSALEAGSWLLPGKSATESIKLGTKALKTLSEADKAKVILSLIKEGAKTNALPGVIGGGSYGVGHELQSNPDATLKSTTQEGITNAVIGGIGGVGIGSILRPASLLGKKGGVATNEAVSNLFKSSPSTDKIIEAISPEPTSKRAIEALQRGEARITPGGTITESKLDYSQNPRIKRQVELVRGVIDPTARPAVNLPKVDQKISDVSKNNVSKFLSENKVPFNFQDFIERLKLKTPQSSLKSEPQALDAYNRIRAEVQHDVYNYLRNNLKGEGPADLNTLWDARKVIDKKITDELGVAALGSPQVTGIKAVAKDLRNEINYFIADSLSYNGNQEKLNTFYQALNDMRQRGIKIDSESEAYNALQKQFGIVDKDLSKGAYFLDQMRDLSDLYDVRDNLIDRSVRERNKSDLGLFFKRNPIASEAARYAGLGSILNVMP